MNECLLKEFMSAKIKAALGSIGDLKTPWPDGMPSMVFKKH